MKSVLVNEPDEAFNKLCLSELQTHRKRTEKVNNWEKWERIHAEQDARDKKILGVAALMIVLLIVLLSSG